MVSHMAILTNVYDFRIEKFGGHATTARCLFRYLKRFWGTRRTHKTTLRGRGENTPKSCSPCRRLWHQLRIIRCATATSLSQKVRIMPDFFRIYRPCYTFNRTEWEGKRTEPKRNFTEQPRKNLENHIVGHYLCIVDNELTRQLYGQLSDWTYRQLIG